MSKLTLGIATGVAIAIAAAVPALASTDAPAPVTAGAATAQARASVAAVTTTKAAPKPPASTTARTTVTTVTLPAPAPAGLVPSPDPRSAACKAAPTQPFCSADSVRYLLNVTTTAAHATWLPVLAKWGLTSVTDTCTVPSAATGEVCAVQAVHGTSDVTVVFKKTYDAAYAPAAVKKQTDAIHVKAMADVAKATTPAQQAQILATATAKITALQKAAAAYVAKHPHTTVNVVVHAA